MSHSTYHSKALAHFWHALIVRATCFKSFIYQLSAEEKRKTREQA